MIPWQFFSAGLGASTNSLVANSELMTKVYFPRLALPIVGILTGVFDMLISFGILAIMMLAYGYFPGIQIIFLPIFILLAGLLAFALGLWFSALNVRIRDIGFGIAFILRIWLYVTPIAYSSQALPAPYNSLYILNPIAPLVEGVRWSIFGVGEFSLGAIILAYAMTTLFLITGLYYFRHVEANFADVV